MRAARSRCVSRCAAACVVAVITAHTATATSTNMVTARATSTAGRTPKMKTWSIAEGVTAADVTSNNSRAGVVIARLFLIIKN